MFGFGNKQQRQVNKQNKQARAAAEDAIANHPEWKTYTDQVGTNTKANWRITQIQVDASIALVNAWIMNTDREMNPLHFVRDPKIIDGVVKECIEQLKSCGIEA